ncbi:hypothetical protein PYW07_002111 [Mythimna separata]|uniref:Rad21/Rec8-like protein N-terminal domain-containing protein n=1 Tax=Mythimna separata TaxID=271217 RepID=A0AAD7YLP7_MYTSE|nr:hypothetical protein PYW07_002111 [Mythimna separata]
MKILAGKQLWSQDIRRICDDLLEVMTNESGRPTNRFSLRLSSQLLRGLVRLYQRKATILLGELCMINANVMKHSKKKWNIHEVVDVEDEEVRLPQLQPLEIREIIEEPPENEQRIEEMIQQSGNVVSNIADITLKEATIGEVLLPPNDGFGEENPEQALQFLQDRTLEQMLVQPDVSTVHSGLEVALDITDKSHDKSRLLHEPAQMERISEHDVTLFRKSTGEELMPEFEKDIPEIPEIPHPELPVPVPDKPQEEPMPEAVVVIERLNQEKPVEIELEELEETAPHAKRRKLRNKLIIDKKTKIGPNYFRARIENPMVELRCEDSSDDIIFIRVPAETYFRRPCHGGEKIASNFGFTISRLFSRNLGVITAQTLEDRHEEQSTEAIRRKSSRTLPRSMLENIEEEQEAHILQVQDRTEIPVELPAPEANVTVNEISVSEPPRVSVPMDVDIADMLTQKVETLSQARKRTAELGATDSPKRQRSVGYVSFRESQLAKEQSQQVPPAPCPVIITDVCDADKENVPANLQQPQPQDAELILSSKLQEAGLADIIQPLVPEVEAHSQTQRVLTSRKTGSDRSETPLGSLDRTKVSLGDSEQTTDSKRFIRDQWGTEGTMVKILKHIKAGLQPVTVTSLLDKGPVISGYRRIIAARCFTSILKLKQHGFINVKKHSKTLEIADVTLGPKLTSLNEL